MFTTAPFNWLATFDNLSLRQLVRSLFYYDQFSDEHMQAQSAQIRVEIKRRISV